MIANTVVEKDRCRINPRSQKATANESSESFVVTRTSLQMTDY